MTSRVVRILGVAALWFLLCPASAVAQGRLHPRREIPGFDFRKDGVWRVRARQIAEVRRALLAQGRMAQLNAPVRAGVPAPSPAAVTGALLVPFVLLS
ncbi:MAG: hypothetical protein ACREME_04940, partial [Gemmatimonadales bacterium]